MYLQQVDNVFNLEWTKGIKYGDVHHRAEVEFSKYNFETADVDMLTKAFDMYEKESKALIKAGLILPAYDYCLKCSHVFNLLDARGAISVTERVGIIGRGRQIACDVARRYVAQ